MPEFSTQTIGGSFMAQRYSNRASDIAIAPTLDGVAIAQGAAGWSGFYAGPVAVGGFDTQAHKFRKYHL